jgi:hypothetical protein
MALPGHRQRSDAMDLSAVTAALVKMGDAAAALEAYPMPRCADPAGLYAKLLGKVRAAGDNARAEPGLAGLMLAKEATQGYQRIGRQLNGELDKTIGANR